MPYAAAILKYTNMQIQFFSIPILDGEAETAALNLFLRSKKILQTEGQLVNAASGAYWCFCIKYIADLAGFAKDKARVDYMEVLDAECFKRFSKMREVRKRIAAEEAIPAYAVFTDEELAGMARIEDLTIAGIRKIKGIGEKKLEKYGTHFLNLTV
jgi:superfamily II DNA helicase RecQ